MNHLESQKRQREFKQKIRNELFDRLATYGYKITYDNEKIKDDGYLRYIFKIQFKGKYAIEIYNEDWRDYTEYFLIKIDADQIQAINVDKYKTCSEAFKELENLIFSRIL